LLLAGVPTGAPKFGQLPFRPVLMSEEDDALIVTARERLAAPLRMEVALDNLLALSSMRGH
jgi:hypothetical protein